MTADGIYEAWRYVNLVLAISAFMLTWIRAAQLWRHLDVQSKLGFMACILFCVVYIEAIVEVLLAGVPGGPRVVIGTLPLIWLVIAGILPVGRDRMATLRKMQPGRPKGRRR